MAQLPLQDTIYSMFFSLNDSKYPVMELLRASLIFNLLDPETAPRNGVFIKSRFDGDSIGIASGSEIDITENGRSGLRVLDLINKTELKCFFIDRIQWFVSYPVEGTRPLLFVYNIVRSLEDKIALRGSKELLSLGVPKETVATVSRYFEDDHPVNKVSGACSMMLLSCLCNLGNKSLDKS